MAIRRDHDVVGIAILAVVTALGGEFLRDPALFRSGAGCGTAIGAAYRSVTAHPRPEAASPRMSTWTAWVPRTDNSCSLSWLSLPGSAV